MPSMVVTTTLAGEIVSTQPTEMRFTIRCRNGEEFQVYAGETTRYEVVTNIHDVPRDRFEPEPHAPEEKFSCYLTDKALVIVEGVFQRHGDQERLDARLVHLLTSRSPQDDPRLVFEETHWWINQVSHLADRWLDQLFRAERDYTVEDFARFYRTNLNIAGQPTDDNIQECLTLSRLIYGLSAAYLVTGSDRYFLAARSAVAYQRQAFRSPTSDGERILWMHGRIRRQDGLEDVVLASRSGADAGTIALYEQIYALAGFSLYYRITGDAAVLDDIRRTMATFRTLYRDKTHGGYFSHLDPVTMDPRSACLKHNRSRKNFNSIVDHVSAYLVNLLLAIEPLDVGKGHVDPALGRLYGEAAGMLEELLRVIVEQFPDPGSRFIRERFLEDWKADETYDWQQNRRIVGHNLKVAWNLTRCSFWLTRRARELRDSDQEKAAAYDELAEKCRKMAKDVGANMADLGVDPLRGGVFDGLEGTTTGMPLQFGWNSTLDFWQQEQGILAYLILYGETRDDWYRHLARHVMAFWNVFFLDRQNRGIFFRTTESGAPVIEGEYAQKSSHSMCAYHPFELSLLAHLYSRWYVDKADGDRRFRLYFRLTGVQAQDWINVLPDFVPDDRLRVTTVTVDGIDRPDLVPGRGDLKIKTDWLDLRERDGSVALAVEFAVSDSPA